jgi:glycosyltransferase involved in cell wall biosynthesis
MLDFYLSEISVSNLHGGGITLQKVLAEDLNKIARYFHLTRFARDFPPVPAVQARSEFLVNKFEEDMARKWLGSRPCDWLINRQISLSWTAKRCGVLVDRFFGGKETLRALVCPQGAPSIQVMESLRTRRNLRYITWMMDDHMVRYVSGRWTYPQEYRKLFKKHLCYADTVFVISPVLQEFYEREFGVKSEVLFGPADTGGPQVYEVPSGDGPLKVAYFGRMWDWQLDGLVRFASALEPGKQRLDVYSADSNLPARLRLPWVQAKGFLPADAVPATMRKYAAVLLPLSFSSAHRNLVELNIATKMSECLASGTVAIVFGPQYAAMVRFLESTGAACVMTEESLVDWPIISARLKNPEFRRQMLDAARRLLETELSTGRMRARWRSALGRLLDGRDDFVAQAQSH